MKDLLIRKNKLFLLLILVTLVGLVVLGTNKNKVFPRGWNYGAFILRQNSSEHVEEVGHVNHTEKKNIIPRIIHQVWNDDIIPTEFVDNVKGLVAHNGPPAWQYYLWTEETSRNLIRDKYPELLYTYDKYPGTCRPDALRYVALYEYGGVYLDLDTVSVRPMEPFILEEHECAFTNEPEEHYAILYKRQEYLANNVLFCAPRHPFYKYIIDSLPKIYAGGCIKTGQQACTGPPALNQLYSAYPNKSVDNLFIMPTDLFNDAYDKHNDFARTCNNKLSLLPVQKEACKNWELRGRNAHNLSSRAYTYHTWFHVNPAHSNVSFKPQNNISLIVPNVQKYKTKP